MLREIWIHETAIRGDFYRPSRGFGISSVVVSTGCAALYSWQTSFARSGLDASAVGDVDLFAG